MPVFLVERELAGATLEQLASAQKAAIIAGKELSAKGKLVRYIRSTFIPGDGRCMCLFEAANAELVREANELANLPFTNIVLAEDLTPL